MATHADPASHKSRMTDYRIFGTLWSLRQYPTPEDEWSLEEKIERVRSAGFDGLMGPPDDRLLKAGTAGLPFWAMATYTETLPVEGSFDRASQLGAEHITIQLGDFDYSLRQCLALLDDIADLSEKYDLPFSIENHRDTFTETPERYRELQKAYLESGGFSYAHCIDHSHFAVLRHIWPPYFEALACDEDVMRGARHFHLRPFTGHSCQIPATDGKGDRIPEYLDWLQYVRDLKRFIDSQEFQEPVFLCVEMGNAHPAYRLSIYPDNWEDTQVVLMDVRSLFKP